MAVLTVDTFCSQDNVEALLSRVGVKLRQDDNADGYVDPLEQEWMDLALIGASQEVEHAYWGMYAPSELATSPLVRDWAIYLAAERFCTHSANPVPESIETQCERVRADLEKKDRIPRLALRRSLGPKWSNPSVDLRFSWRVIRRQRQTSSKDHTSLPQSVDYREAWSYEI